MCFCMLSENLCTDLNLFKLLKHWFPLVHSTNYKDLENSPSMISSVACANIHSKTSLVRGRTASSFKMDELTKPYQFGRAGARAGS